MNNLLPAASSRPPSPRRPKRPRPPPKPRPNPGPEAGKLRADIDPVDVGGILAGVLSVAGAPGQQAQLDRMLTVVVDGLRAR